MAYATGSAANVAALLAALETFAVANGWTSDVSDSISLVVDTGAASTNAQSSLVPLVSAGLVTTGNTISSPVTATRVGLSKSGAHFQIFGFKCNSNKNGVGSVDHSFIEIWGADAYSGAANYYSQTNVKRLTITSSMANSFAAYHLFSDGDYIHLVIEETTGNFFHVSFGFIEKYTAFTGGQYAMCSSFYEYPYVSSARTWEAPYTVPPFTGPTSFNGDPTYPTPTTRVRADIDSLSNNWLFICGVSNAQSGGAATWASKQGGASYRNPNPGRALAGGGGYEDTRTLIGDIAYQLTPQPWNGVAPFTPLWVPTTRTPFENWSLLGHYPDVRYLNMSDYSPGQEITLGSDTWKIFPCFAKVYTADGGLHSYDHAIAYRKAT